MNAQDFAMKRAASHGFSLDRQEAATALRKLADEIASGQITLSSVRCTSLGKTDSFAVSVLRISFYERLPDDVQR